MSPKVPIFSTSATNVSPAAPPIIPTPYLAYFDFVFKSFTLFKASVKFVLFPVLPNSAYAFVLFAFNALAVKFLAALFANLNPIVPGTPT